MSETNPLSFGAGLFLLAWIIVVSYPLFIYSWWKLKAYYFSDFFAARGTRLIIYQTIIMFISANIITVIGILYEDLMIIKVPKILWSIIDIIDQGILLGIFLIMALRIWIVNYTHSLQQEMVKQTWKSQLSLFMVDKTSFYVKHKSKLGSYKYMTKVCGFIYIFSCTALVLLSIASPENPTASYSLLALEFLFVIIVIAVVWFKYPKFKDRYHIRQELKEQILFSIFTMILGVSMVVMGNIIGNEGFGTFGQYTGVIIADGLCFILVLRVVRLNVYAPNSTQDEKHLAQEFWDGYNKYELKDVLNNEFGYEEFMNALIQEFASENLLFATEYTQFRTNLGITASDIECIEFNTCLSDQASLSYSSMKSQTASTADFSKNDKAGNKEKEENKDTVIDVDSDKTFFLDMVQLLYLKYIKNREAPFEINISFENRNSLAQFIDDEYDSEFKGLPSNATLQQVQKILIPILEGILVEVVKLLGNSFRRFKKSDKWVQVCQVLSQNTKKSVSSIPSGPDHETLNPKVTRASSHTSD